MLNTRQKNGFDMEKALQESETLERNKQAALEWLQNEQTTKSPTIQSQTLRSALEYLMRDSHSDHGTQRLEPPRSHALPAPNAQRCIGDSVPTAMLALPRLAPKLAQLGGAQRDEELTQTLRELLEQNLLYSAGAVTTLERWLTDSLSETLTQYGFNLEEALSPTYEAAINRFYDGTLTLSLRTDDHHTTDIAWLERELHTLPKALWNAQYPRVLQDLQQHSHATGSVWGPGTAYQHIVYRHYNGDRSGRWYLEEIRHGEGLDHEPTHDEAPYHPQEVHNSFKGHRRWFKPRTPKMLLRAARRLEKSAATLEGSAQHALQTLAHLHRLIANGSLEDEKICSYYTHNNYEEGYELPALLLTRGLDDATRHTFDEESEHAWQAGFAPCVQFEISTEAENENRPALAYFLATMPKLLERQRAIIALLSTPFSKAG